MVLPALLFVLLTPTSGWVLFSPVVRTLGYKAYEDATNTPWVDPSSFNLEVVSLRWGLPPSSYSDEALASGISFALHRDFCERLMPLFPERTDIGRFFLSCDDLRDTVKRAADTWAINHKKINFIDRTDACRDVTGTQSCPYAELFIVPDDIERSDSSSNDLAVRAPFNSFLAHTPVSFSLAHALFNSNLAQAEVTHDLGSIDYYPYSTAGFRLNPGLGVVTSRMSVRAPTYASTFCWYLDSTFCYQFHRWQYASVDVILIGRIVCAVVFGLAVLVVIYVFASMMYAVGCEVKAPVEFNVTQMPGQERRGGKRSGSQDRAESAIDLAEVLQQAGGGRKTIAAGRAAMERRSVEGQLTCGSKRCTNLVDYISVAPTLMLLAALFWMIFAPIFYFRVFMPCWECYDFEATIAHEIGHVLGFHHPDTEWELNLNAHHPMNNLTCQRPFDHVYLNQTERGLPDSIMFSMTQHQDRTCLSADDLEGLNYLYPVCEGAFDPLVDTGEPLCIKVQRLTGWLRLLYTVIVPFVIVSFFVISLQLCVRHQQRKRMVSLEATSERLREQRKLLLKKMKEGAKRRASAVGGATRRQSVERDHDPNRRSVGFNLGRSLSGRLGTPRGETTTNTREVELERQLQAANQQVQQLEDIQMRAAIAASQEEPSQCITRNSGACMSTGGASC